MHEFQITIIAFTSITNYIEDGTTTGDGTEKGNCPMETAGVANDDYRCLSDGVCNICGLISGYAEGCDIFSTSPVCDADSTTAGTQDSATDKVAACVACTKSGMLLFTMKPHIIKRCYYVSILLNGKLMVFVDGTTTGDGTTIGKCPSSYSNYRCLSTGACNVCGLISGVAQGCEIRSSTPVCDMDSSTSGIQDTASNKVAQCVACKKSGNYLNDPSKTYQLYQLKI